MRGAFPVNKNSIIHYTFLLMFIIGIFAGLYLGRKFFIPVTFGIFLAMLMLPVCEWLEEKIKVRWVAVLLSDFIILIFMLAFLGFVTWQLTSLASSLGQSKQQAGQSVQQLGQWLKSTFGLQIDQIFQQFSSSISSYIGQLASLAQKFIVNFFKFLIGVLIVLVYIFFFLYYRHIFVKFLLKLVQEEKKEKTEYIVANLAKVTYKYLAGRLIVIAIIAVLLVTGLSIIGIKNAIFFGVIAAFLDLLPFLGIIIGAGLPIIMAIINHQGWSSIIWVIALFTFVQLLENYFLTPKIVGNKVKLNPLFVFMVVLIGGYLWGIAGLILFIPLLAMTKVLLDHVDTLNPYGYLVGEPEHRTAKS